MKLSEEIKQKKFKSEYQKLAINLVYTANWLNYHHEKSCRKFGITSEQFNILRILRGQHPKPATVNLLIERMLNKTSNASRLVEKLRVKEMVARQTSENDRRACDVIITKKGLALLKQLDAVESEWNELLEPLSEAESKKMNQLLDKLRTKQ